MLFQDTHNTYKNVKRNNSYFIKLNLFTEGQIKGVGPTVLYKKNNGQLWYKYLGLGRDKSYFVLKKKGSNSTKKFSETDIINMIEFLIDNIFAMFGGRIVQQRVGIPMGTNRAPLLADFIRMRQTSCKIFSRKTERS